MHANYNNNIAFYPKKVGCMQIDVQNIITSLKIPKYRILLLKNIEEKP